MNLTSLAVILLGLYLVVKSQTAVNATFTLIWGLVVIALVVLDTLSVGSWRRVP